MNVFISNPKLIACELELIALCDLLSVSYSTSVMKGFIEHLCHFIMKQ